MTSVGLSLSARRQMRPGESEHPLVDPPAEPPAISCSWCDSPMAAYISIPGEKIQAACGKHLEKLEPLVLLRAIEVGLGAS